MDEQFWWYECQGYEYEKEGQLFESVTVGVYADSEEQALEKAKARVRRRHWRVRNVIEHQPRREHPAWVVEPQQRFVDVSSHNGPVALLPLPPQEN